MLFTISGDLKVPTVFRKPASPSVWFH